MPYYITDNAEGCSGWATVKDDGEELGCHMTKEDAIDQMVALSLAEDIEPGGERKIHKKKMKYRAKPDELEVGDFVSWRSSSGRARGRITRIKTDGDLTAPESDFTVTGTPDDPAALIRIYEQTEEGWRETPIIVVHRFTTLTKIDELRSEQRELPDNYRPALAEDVPEGRACGNCYFFNEERQNEEGTKAWCEKWDDYVDGGYYCNAWQPEDMENRAPAPKEDQIEGSDKNKPGSAKGAGGDITLDEQTETGLRNKVKDHNEAMAEDDRPSWTRTTYGQLAAVFRRGAGAFSTSHRPGMTRNQWAMARVNAYLYLLRRGRPENPKYITDYDLLPTDHPKSTRSMPEARAINQSAPAYMRAAARRGLELYEAGEGGAGLTQKTIREARLMAEGQVSDDKWTRLGPWIARHMPDLDAPKNSNRRDPEYPGAGLVAHLLWGSGPTKRAAERAMEYAEGVVARIRAEERTMTDTTEKLNRWADVARAIQKKIDGEPNTKEPEIRTNSTKFEVRSEGDGMTFTGYASVFNSSSEDLGGFREFVAPGAFKRSLQSRNEIKLLWNHDTSEPLASLRNGSLELTEDRYGLKVKARLPKTTRGKDVAELLRSKVIDSMSFGFNVIKDSWSEGGSVRTLESVRLSEVSIVTYPAYAATTAQVRSIQPTIDADELANALLKLESGEDLDEKSAALITDVVGKLRQQPETEVGADNNGLALLDLKKKQLDLLLKRI